MGLTTLLDRWQFGITTVYHFIFVPLTIGLALLVAIMQTLAYRRQDGEWDQLSRFFGKLFLINFAMGVATGIVQEFQFGMNWSNYSVFVGNIFGAPLAIEGLLAFFMESTFLGLWIFGRDKLSPRLHLATIWLVAAGTTLSALFILAANAWMQHPVGYKIVDHKALLTDFWALFANPALWGEFIHTTLAAFTTAAMVVLGVSAWKLLRHQNVNAFLRSFKLSAVFGLVMVLLTMIVGDLQARLMDTEQPMKIAAAEALYNTPQGELLAVHDRQSLGSTDLPDSGPTPSQPDRHADVEREGVGHQPGTGRGSSQVRRWQLHTGDLDLLLELPVDDRSRYAHPCRDRGGVVPPPAQVPDADQVQVVPLGHGRGHLVPLLGEHLRLAVHRDGPPALDRLRAHED
jgi:hypothetical protein